MPQFTRACRGGAWYKTGGNGCRFACVLSAQGLPGPLFWQLAFG
jgi:hypothetical protein